MTVKERLQQVVAEMSEEEAEQALALVSGARAGATPTDVYGTAWGKVLDGIDPEILTVTGTPSISIPDGVLTSKERSGRRGSRRYRGRPAGARAFRCSAVPKMGRRGAAPSPGPLVAFNPTEWYAFSDHDPTVATFEDREPEHERRRAGPSGRNPSGTGGC